MFEASMNEHECSMLYDFVTDCHLPETIQVVDGYESLESEKLSWGKDDIINLHTLREISWVIAKDVHERFFSFPLTYNGKIFESIPIGCADKYETVEELIVPLPKYVRSLRDIPQSGVVVGDIISLLDASKASSGGHKELKCKVVGKPSTIFLSGNQFGPFETLNDANPTTIQEIINRNRLPTRVRVLAGKTQAFNEANTSPPVRFEGLFTLEQAVKQKVFIVSTLVERHLSILKLPIYLEITVRREKSKIHPNVFSHICHLIEAEVDVDSTITCGNTGDASWYFDDIDNDIKLCMYETPSNDNRIYEELRPLVPPRTPPAKVSPDESHLKQNKNTGDVSWCFDDIDNDINLCMYEAPSNDNHAYEEIRPLVPPRTPPAKASPHESHLKQNKISNIWSIISIDRLTKQKANPKPKTTSVASVAQTSNVQAAPSRPAGKKPNQLIMTKLPSFNSFIPKCNNSARCTTQTENPTSSQKTLGDTISQVPHQMASGWQEDTTVKEFRKRLKGISVYEVGEWLRKLGLSRYVDLFVEELIDGAMLLELDEEMMQCIGIENALHRKKFLMFIHRGWTSKQH